MGRSSTRPPSRRTLAAAGGHRRHRGERRPGAKGMLLVHPTRRLVAQRELPLRVVARLVSDLAPADGWALGLAFPWPPPEIARRVRETALALWEEELRHAKLDATDRDPLADALRARADGLRNGPRAHSLGAIRLASLLHAAADEISAVGS